MGKVLFVDDEQMILNSVKRGIRKCKFEAYYALSGAEALRIIDKVDIDVVMSDMKMPEMSGLELLKKIEETHPEIVKVIVSGYAQLPQLIATINQTSIFKYISKPFDLYGELIPVINQALDFAVFKKESAIKKAALESKNAAYRNIFKTMKTKAETKGFGLDQVRIYQQVIMNMMKEQVVDQTLSEDKQLMLLDSYKRLSENYLMEIKKNDMYFEPVRIMNEVEYMLKKDNFKITIEKGIDDTSKSLYEGRGTHLKPIILNIIEDYVTKKDIGTIKIVSTEISRDENKVYLMYLIEGNVRLLKNVRLDDYNMKLYKSILNIFGGDLELKISDELVDIVIKVRMYLETEGDIDELPNS